MRLIKYLIFYWAINIFELIGLNTLNLLLDSSDTIAFNQIVISIVLILVSYGGILNFIVLVLTWIFFNSFKNIKWHKLYLFVYIIKLAIIYMSYETQGKHMIIKTVISPTLIYFVSSGLFVIFFILKEKKSN